jgi:hypothetical protein
LQIKPTTEVERRFSMEIQALVCGDAENAAFSVILGIFVKNELDRPFFAQNAVANCTTTKKKSDGI